MLKELRLNRGISSSFVASKLGISRGRFSRIEKGESELPARLVPDLANIYSVKEKEIVRLVKGDYQHA